MSETTKGLEFRLIRHGPKYPATHPNKELANCLTEEGRKAAYEYGREAKKAGYQKIHIFSSNALRAKQTAAYISAGFSGVSSVETYVQEYAANVEQELEQMEPESPFVPYYANLCTRKEAIEKCYAMLRADIDSSVDPNEIMIMQTGTTRYIEILEKYVRNVSKIREASAEKLQEEKKETELHLFIGHDPNIGGLQQKLEQAALISELGPLEGITFRVRGNDLLYEFSAENKMYTGTIKQL